MNKLFEPPTTEEVEWDTFWDSLTDLQQQVLSYITIDAKNRDIELDKQEAIEGSQSPYRVGVSTFDTLQECLGTKQMSMLLLKSQNMEAISDEKLNQMALEATEEFFAEHCVRDLGAYSFMKTDAYKRFSKWVEIIEWYTYDIHMYHGQVMTCIVSAINFFKAEFWDTLDR